LYAWTFQLLSRFHSRLRNLNWCLGRQLNLVYIIFQAISRFQPRRWCRRTAGAAWVDRSVADLAWPATGVGACAVRAAAGLTW
jgi:hypothetical protein